MLTHYEELLRVQETMEVLEAKQREFLDSPDRESRKDELDTIMYQRLPQLYNEEAKLKRLVDEEREKECIGRGQGLFVRL